MTGPAVNPHQRVATVAMDTSNLQSLRDGCCIGKPLRNEGEYPRRLYFPNSSRRHANRIVQQIITI